MSRRVCKFINPKTGETDWLEPNTVAILRAHCDEFEHVAYSFSNIDAERVVTIKGETSGHAVTVKIDEMIFAHELARVVYGNLSLDDDAWFVRQYSIIATEIQRSIDDNLWDGEA